MTCDRLTAEELVTWLDGEADSELAARVAGHVAECAECRREADLLRETGALLAQIPSLAPAPAPSADFEARTFGRIRVDVQVGGRVLADAAAPVADTHAAPRGRLRSMRPRVAAVAAAILAVAVVAGSAAWWLSTPNDNDVLTAREAEALADDLVVISNLDALQEAETTDLAELADDLDVIDDLSGEEEGG